MRLNELTLSELSDFMMKISTLVTAGRALESGGLGPVFDLTPGAPICIFTNAVTPGAPEVEPEVRITKTRVDVQIRDERTSFLKPRSTEAPSDAPDAEPVDPPPALGEVAGGGAPAVEQSGPPAGAEISAQPSRPAEADDVPQDAAAAGAGAESGGGGEAATPQAPAAPEQRQPASAWTKAEDDALIRLIVQGMMDEGLSRKAAIIAAARSIGRPEPGTLWRVAKVIKAQVDAALTAAATKQAQTETPEIPPAEPVGASVSRDAAAGGQSPAAVQPEPQKATVSGAADPITAHIMALPEDGGWTLDRDATLMELSIAGWQPNEIALEVGMRADQIKVRFDALTGLYLDANRKPVRRFAREDVMAALTRLCAAA